MQQINKPIANQQVGQTFAPKKKPVNKTVTPVSQTAQPTDKWQSPDYNPNANNSVNPNKPLLSYGATSAAKPSKENDVVTVGEREDQKAKNQVPQPPQAQQPAAPLPDTSTPQTNFSANEYQSNGYTGVQGNTDYSYDPREESLVQNQITGLLDPNSDMMRKAISQAQGYNASRGLQSSSLGSEVALSSMIDKALPIAQQDASTYATADQTGWDQSFTADQNNLSREHETSMFDKQGELTTNLQNDQLDFTNMQSNADRQQQSNLQNLQHQQNLSTLDKQEAIQTRRDELMNSFDMSKMDKTYLQDLEKTQITWEHDDDVFTRNMDGQVALEYKNATSDAYNNYLEQVAAVYSNPNMTAEQQAAGVNKLKEMYSTQRQQMQVIYSITPGNESYIDLGDEDKIYGPAAPNVTTLQAGNTNANAYGAYGTYVNFDGRNIP
jgi:hypothetical protein